MFVRTKTIKDKKYGYLVQNTWKKQKVKQTVKKYLGKLITLDKKYSKEIKKVEDFDWDKPLKLIFREIIADEFERRGFVKKNTRYILDDLIVNLSTCKIQEKGKDVVLLLNGRYVFGKLLAQIQNFYASEEGYERGKALATLFSDVGINVDKEVFVALYRKIYLSKD